MILLTCGKLRLTGKMLKVMKLTIFLLTAAFLQVSANGNAQNVSFSGENVPLTTVFASIEKQTGFVFFYNNESIKKSEPLTVNFSNVTLEAALRICLRDLPLSYSIKGRTIFISPVSQTSLLENQNRVVTIPPLDLQGRVLNEQGEPLVGVTILIKGTNIGTKTDGQGRFTLNNIEKDAILVFSYVGYSSSEYKLAGDKNEISITLTQKTSSLSDLVMVGYGTTRRKDLTGAVSSINVKEINNTPLITIDQALAGKASGVQVTQSDGSPGGVARIRIRGGTSLIGGNDPLYIIDGVQIQVGSQYIGAGAELTNLLESAAGSSRDASRGQAIGSSFGRGLNTLAGLNINDIESIDILKDASATAIYGSKAANGVVIITTKKGKKNEKPLLEANYNTTFARAITENVLTADEYRAIYLKGAQNLNKRLAEKNLPADPAATAYINNPSLLGTANIDWIDMVTRTGITHNADISMRGGGTGSSYYTSLAYNTTTGTLLGTDFSRISGKINLMNEVTSKLRLITNLDFGFTKNSITNGIYSAAVLAPPTWEPFNPDGTISAFPNAIFPGSNSTASGIVNPMSLLRGKNEADGSLLLGSMTLEYDILKDLKFRSIASVNYSTSHQLTYQPSTVSAINNLLGSTSGTTGVGSESQLQNKDLFFENTLTWNREFNENHRLNLLGGTAWQKTSSNRFSANGQTYPDDDFLNGLSSAAIYLRPTAAKTYASLLSFYVRANYTFKERYLLTLTGRSDASSKFPKANRVGYFPSFGVAWRISDETFLKNVSWLNELKLRASAGYTGTQNIGDNMFYTLYTPVSYSGVNALIPSQLGNDQIKWENTLQKDLGLDIALFNNRFNASIGYYEKYTEGLLMAGQIPQSTGFSSAILNKADVRNRGLEIELRGDVLSGKNFSWNIGLNVSGNRSMLMKLNRLLPSATSIGQDNPIATGESIGNYALVPGQPLGQMYGAIFLGLLRTQKEVTDYIWVPGTNPNGSIWVSFNPSFSAIGLGYPRFQTTGEAYGPTALATQILNRARIGSATPDFYGGMTHTFSYKKLSVMANFTYSYGGNILYLFESTSLGLGDLRNRSDRILLPTYGEDPASNRPLLLLKETNTATGAGASSLNIFDASYIKLKSLNISYALPQAWLSRIGLRQGLVYVSGSNLFVITKYPGPDPEVSNDPYTIIGGNTDDASFPQSRQFSIGVRFGF
jgi:TonB-linked SusC/RagA family outer membrane protein